MATVEECQAAVSGLLAGLTKDPAKLAELPERSLACVVPDLGVTFRGDFRGGAVHDVRQGDAGGAQVVLTADSDDVVALCAGELDLLRAWTGRRVSISLSLKDKLLLLRLLR
jgi:predicted lipid carrier protein YhbT